jgi:glycosyltransferase involved in cell wall biosynthesis
VAYSDIGTNSLAHDSLRVLHVTASIGQTSFGVGQVAVDLAVAQVSENGNAHIWCLDTEDQISWAIRRTSLVRERVSNFRSFGPSRLAFSKEMFAAARLDGGIFDVVHQHGIWTACSQTANILRKAHHIPVVIAPHGSLQHWALLRSRWKKRLAFIVYEGRNLKGAACLHATGEAEIGDFRDYGLSNPIALIPNGVSASWVESEGSGLRFRRRYAIAPDRRVLLFLSRITPKKGLPVLLDAIDRIRSDFGSWLLVIAGTDEFDHLREVKSLVTKLNLPELVMFTGPLYGEAKRDAFAASEAFVLPSYSEGSPMVVLDSLAVGVPVITTKGTPWSCLLDYQCGWWVEASSDGISEALRDLIGLCKEKLHAMGHRSRELVMSQYLWKTQADKTLKLYAWLLGRGDKPDFVIND